MDLLRTEILFVLRLVCHCATTSTMTLHHAVVQGYKLQHHSCTTTLRWSVDSCAESDIKYATNL
jgi:hypothetical protein